MSTLDTACRVPRLIFELGLCPTLGLCPIKFPGRARAKGTALMKEVIQGAASRAPHPAASRRKGDRTSGEESCKLLRSFKNGRRAAPNIRRLKAPNILERAN